MARKSDLEVAYRATIYRIDLPDGPCDLKIGVREPLVERWLISLGLRSFSIVTAYNPGSRCLSVVDNETRHQRLLARVIDSGLPFVQGVNLAVSPADWPAEPTLVMAGFDERAGVDLATDFGQCAMVYGELGEAPRLVWIE